MKEHRILSHLLFLRRSQGRQGKQRDTKKVLLVALNGELYFVKFIINPEEDDVELGVVFGRSFLRLTKGIVDFGNGIITIYPDLVSFNDDSDDDWEAIIDGVDFSDLPQLDEIDVPTTARFPHDNATDANIIKYFTTHSSEGYILLSLGEDDMAIVHDSHGEVNPEKSKLEKEVKSPNLLLKLALPKVGHECPPDARDRPSHKQHGFTSPYALSALVPIVVTPHSLHFITVAAVEIQEEEEKEKGNKLERETSE
ncbi:hypothetical protein Tco_1143086 [Tanacetum coccineum]